MLQTCLVRHVSGARSQRIEPRIDKQQSLWKSDLMLGTNRAHLGMNHAYVPREPMPSTPGLLFRAILAAELLLPAFVYRHLGSLCGIIRLTGIGTLLPISQHYPALCHRPWLRRSDGLGHPSLFDVANLLPDAIFRSPTLFRVLGHSLMPTLVPNFRLFNAPQAAERHECRVFICHWIIPI